MYIYTYCPNCNREFKIDTEDGYDRFCPDCNTPLSQYDT